MNGWKIIVMSSWKIVFYLITMNFMLLAFISCNSNGMKSQEKELNFQELYFDYRVWGDEESGVVTARIQYREGGPEGRTIELGRPGKVSFDGVELKADSSKMNGVHYEINRWVKDFAGRHNIVLSGPGKKQYREEFNFPIFSLKKAFPKSHDRSDLVVEFNGLADDTRVQVILTDTAFYSRGIEKTDSVRNGRIVIPGSELQNLNIGPIHVEIYVEIERGLKEPPTPGGSLYLFYGLRKEFELRE